MFIPCFVYDGITMSGIDSMTLDCFQLLQSYDYNNLEYYICIKCNDVSLNWSIIQGQVTYKDVFEQSPESLCLAVKDYDIAQYDSSPVIISDFITLDKIKSTCAWDTPLDTIFWKECSFEQQVILNAAYRRLV